MTGRTERGRRGGGGGRRGTEGGEPLPGSHRRHSPPGDAGGEGDALADVGVGGGDGERVGAVEDVAGPERIDRVHGRHLDLARRPVALRVVDGARSVGRHDHTDPAAQLLRAAVGGVGAGHAEVVRAEHVRIEVDQIVHHRFPPSGVDDDRHTDRSRGSGDGYREGGVVPIDQHDVGVPDESLRVGLRGGGDVRAGRVDRHHAALSFGGVDADGRHRRAIPVIGRQIDDPHTVTLEVCDDDLRDRAAPDRRDQGRLPAQRGEGHRRVRRRSPRREELRRGGDLLVRRRSAVHDVDHVQRRQSDEDASRLRHVPRARRRWAARHRSSGRRPPTCCAASDRPRPPAGRGGARGCDPRSRTRAACRD